MNSPPILVFDGPFDLLMVVGTKIKNIPNKKSRKNHLKQTQTTWEKNCHHEMVLKNRT